MNTSAVTNWLGISIVGGTLALFLLIGLLVAVAVMGRKLTTLIRLLAAQARQKQGEGASPDAGIMQAVERLSGVVEELGGLADALATSVENADRNLESRPAKGKTIKEYRRVVAELQTELAKAREKIDGGQRHNIALHRESADLRARLAKLSKSSAAQDDELGAIRKRLGLAAGQLAATTNERDAARREVDALKLEVERLTAEIKALQLRAVAPGTPPASTAPDPAKPLPTTLKPPIVTRTTKSATSGVGEFDEEDKKWEADEDTGLLTAYLSSRSVTATAESLCVDQRQVALRLVKLLLAPHGTIDDPTAPNHGKTYSAADSKAIIKAWRDGRKLPAIARDFQRDQLGIGWKLLDDRSQPVELTDSMIPDIVEGAHR